MYAELSRDIRFLTQKRTIELCINGYGKLYGARVPQINDNERIKMLFELFVSEIEVMQTTTNDLSFSEK